MATKQNQMLNEKLGDKDVFTREIESRNQTIAEWKKKFEQLEGIHEHDVRSYTQSIQRL